MKEGRRRRQREREETDSQTESRRQIEAHTLRLTGKYMGPDEQRENNTLLYKDKDLSTSRDSQR